jgi:hypothetical protein
MYTKSVKGFVEKYLLIAKVLAPSELTISSNHGGNDWVRTWGHEDVKL